MIFIILKEILQTVNLPYLKFTTRQSPCHKITEGTTRNQAKQKRKFENKLPKTTHQAFKLPIKFTVIYWLGFILII